MPWQLLLCDSASLLDYCFFLLHATGACLQTCGLWPFSVLLWTDCSLLKEIFWHVTQLHIKTFDLWFILHFWHRFVVCCSFVTPQLNSQNLFSARLQWRQIGKILTISKRNVDCQEKSKCVFVVWLMWSEVKQTYGGKSSIEKGELTSFSLTFFCHDIPRIAHMWWLLIWAPSPCLSPSAQR